MLPGIAILNTGYFDNTNEKNTTQNKTKRHCQDNIGPGLSYCFRTKTRDTVPTIPMYTMLIIYSSKDTKRNLKYI